MSRKKICTGRMVSRALSKKLLSVVVNGSKAAEGATGSASAGVTGLGGKSEATAAMGSEAGIEDMVCVGCCEVEMVGVRREGIE